MTPDLKRKLEELGRAAAREVAGAAAFGGVKVEDSSDSEGEPAYYFWFQIDEDSALQPLGMVQIRLWQSLRDRLIWENDDHPVKIQLLDRIDWERRAGA